MKNVRRFWKRSRTLNLGLVSLVALSLGCGASRQGAYNMDRSTLGSATESAALDMSGWDARDDYETLKNVIAKWETTAATAPSVEVFGKLARAHYFLADGHYGLRGEDEKRDAHYDAALGFAEKAMVSASPEYQKARQKGDNHETAVAFVGAEGLEALYWYASSLGKWAASKGFATRLKHKDAIKATMDRIHTLDKSFFHYGSSRLLGSFEAKTAGLAGGSLEKSGEHFQAAVENAPYYIGSKVLWADYLATKQNDKELFLRLLNEVVSSDPNTNPEVAPENKVEIAKAKKLLSEVDERF